jgi:hypothetical protein
MSRPDSYRDYESVGTGSQIFYLLLINFVMLSAAEASSSKSYAYQIIEIIKELVLVLVTIRSSMTKTESERVVSGTSTVFVSNSEIR